MELQETYRVTGPQLEVLGRAETALPAPARKRPVALGVLVAAALAAVLALGGLKLKGEYKAVSQLYHSENDGYSIGYLVDQSQNYAANMIRVASEVLDSQDPALTGAQEALEALEQAETPSQEYQAESQLVSRVKELYETVSPLLEGSRYDSFRGQYQEALSAWEQSGHMTYNQEAAAYNETAASFPANLIAGLWGVQEVELYQ